MTSPLPPTDDHRDGPPAPIVDPTAIPRRRQPLLERPTFWLTLVVAGVVLAVALSFLAEKTDVTGTPGDVGHYCQQVAVIKRTNPLALAEGGPGNTQQAELFVQELTSLELVAPGTVKDDVHEVRLSAEDVLNALRAAEGTDPAAAGALLSTISRAEARSEDAITQMTEYTQEACGIDLSPTVTQVPGLPPGLFPPTTTG